MFKKVSVKDFNVLIILVKKYGERVLINKIMEINNANNMLKSIKEGGEDQ